MTKLNETQYKQILDAVMASENGPSLSQEKIMEMLDFFEKSYNPIKDSIFRLLNSVAVISVDDLIRNNVNVTDPFKKLETKLEDTIYEFGDEIGKLDDYLIEIGGELYEKSTALYKKYNRLGDVFTEIQLILQSVENIADTVNDNNLNLVQYLEAPIEIAEGEVDEKFASKAQQKYFYAKAGDESLSPKERAKWKEMAGEFSSKTDYSHLPDKA